ncbi:MAG: glycoside hydrolase family 88 protein [Cyclobacteriaceae bacterium]
MKIDQDIKVGLLSTKLERFWTHAREKALLLEKEYDTSIGSPVFTINGKYTTRGWTEWTQGFVYGTQILVGEALEDNSLIELGKKNTIEKMAHHLSHFGVHDHGFNNLSTYGNLLRLSRQGILDSTTGDREFYKLALQMSGSVQAKRWSDVKDGGYIYSFNGPHSLFIDTIRTVRILLAAHLVGHRMLDENDVEIDLLDRAMVHGMTTAKYAVYYGEGRDSYDVWGRVAHESVFNLNDGNYRCPNAQQGFSGFTTWTRGLAWAMVGYAEFLEYLIDNNIDVEGIADIKETFFKAAKATCDFYIDNTSSDGIPYWDTGAPQIHKLGDYQSSAADPNNPYEPVDSSAAAIGAAGLLRLGKLLEGSDKESANKYTQAGLTTLNTLLGDTYLGLDKSHQGILLHSVYHQPNGWDHIPEGSSVPNGEACMWGDYHMVELCLLAKRLSEGKYYRFFDTLKE